MRNIVTALPRLCAVPLALIAASSISAVTVEEFNKDPIQEQASYVSGAVSMMSYSYAAAGERERAKCVYEWYFKQGSDGSARRGPAEMAREIVKAAKLNSKLHVEGIILGMIDKACPAPPPAR